MDYVVAKPFKSINRKFEVVGEPITRGDIDPGTFLTFKQWMERGFIAATGKKVKAEKPGEVVWPIEESSTSPDIDPVVADEKPTARRPTWPRRT